MLFVALARRRVVLTVLVRPVLSVRPMLRQEVRTVTRTVRVEVGRARDVCETGDTVPVIRPCRKAGLVPRVHFSERATDAQTSCRVLVKSTVPR